MSLNDMQRGQLVAHARSLDNPRIIELQDIQPTMPEAIILIGAQASGKSTFYRDYFFRTHVRINLDMLKTRHRELRLLQTCLETGQSFVIDNTNPTRKARERYLKLINRTSFESLAIISSRRSNSVWQEMQHVH